MPFRLARVLEHLPQHFASRPRVRGELALADGDAAVGTETEEVQPALVGRDDLAGH